MLVLQTAVSQSFLRYQITELSEADIKPGEREELQQQKKKIQAKEKIEDNELAESLESKYSSKVVEGVSQYGKIYKSSCNTTLRRSATACCHCKSIGT